VDVGSVVAELRNEADRISRALSALTGLGAAPGRKRRVRTKVGKSRAKKRGGLTAAGRKRLSMLMKKRWAARKKSGAKKL
jgi:hypothetical protein